MWCPHTAQPEQHLRNAVASGARAARSSDGAAFEAAASRLEHLHRPWVYRVLDDTAALLAEELGLARPTPWPPPAAETPVEPDSPLPRPDLCPPAAGSGNAEDEIRRRLLLIAHLANAAEVEVDAFLDVALAGNSQFSRPPSGAIPHCRVGSPETTPHTSFQG